MLNIQSHCLQCIWGEAEIEFYFSRQRKKNPQLENKNCLTGEKYGVYFPRACDFKPQADN